MVKAIKLDIWQSLVCFTFHLSVFGKKERGVNAVVNYFDLSLSPAHLSLACGRFPP